MELPGFRLQLFPTPGDLSEESELVLGLALQDYLKATFEAAYPEVEDDDEETTTTTNPQLISTTVELVSFTSVTSTDTRQRQRQLQGRQGTEVEVEATLTFKDETIPESSDIETQLDDALYNNFATFVTDYLSFYATDELEGIESGTYLSGATTAPSMAPTTEPPSTSGGGGGVIAAINNNTPVNVQSDTRLRALIPAAICGIAMFLLTTLFFAHRRRQLKSFHLDGADSESGYGGEDFAVDHISIDYDGREEARQLQLEQQQMQQDIDADQLHELRELRKMEQERFSRPKPTQGTISSERVQGSAMALHVPPVMEARSSSRHYEPSAMVVGSASSSVGSSYYDDRELNSLSGSEWSTDNNVNIYGGQRKLPSMMGGGEFGAGSVINRGLI